MKVGSPSRVPNIFVHSFPLDLPGQTPSSQSSTPEQLDVFPDSQFVAPSAPQSASFYPSYFYPPPSFVPIGPDGQPMQADANGQPVMHSHPQYYPLHPAYAPFAAYPHPATAGYPMMAPGHMSPTMQQAQPGPSVVGGDNAAAAGAPEASPAKSAGSNKDSNGNDKDNQGASPPRRKRQRVAANANNNSAGGKDDNGLSQ